MDILYTGAIYSCSGYARIRHLLIELDKLGLGVKTKPFHIHDNILLKDIEKLRQFEKTKISEKYISISSGIPYQFTYDKKAVYNIGYTMFEANTIPKEWVECCNKMDEIWVPTETNFDIFRIAGVTVPINIVRYGVDTELFNYSENKLKGFTFLSIGTFIDRKGWDILIESYMTEFNEKEDVRLVIKLDGTNTNSENEIKKYIKKYSKENSPKIIIANVKVNDKDIVSFYKKANCYVMPSRGEGFGLTYLESLAVGVPVIATDFNENSFLTKDNSWFIKVKEMQQASSRLCLINKYYENLWFFEPDVDSLKSTMRYVFNHKDECIEKGKNGVVTAEEYSYKNIAKDVRNLLSQIGE